VPALESIKHATIAMHAKIAGREEKAIATAEKAKS
jgi:hypothetical protein